MQQKKQWETFANQCQKYKGHLYTEYEYHQYYTIKCYFPDMTTKTKEENTRRQEEMGATWWVSYNHAEGEDTAKYGAIKYIKEDTLELYK